VPFAVACNNEQKITVNVIPLTDKGNPAQVDGPITVVVQSGDGTVEQDTVNAPLAFKAVSGVALADTVYLVSADADLGAGVTTISDTVTLTVSSAAAANFGFSAGPVEPK
jgi:hypothetical protein